MTRENVILHPISITLLRFPTSTCFSLRTYWWKYLRWNFDISHPPSHGPDNERILMMVIPESCSSSLAEWQGQSLGASGRGSDNFWQNLRWDVVNQSHSIICQYKKSEKNCFTRQQQRKYLDLNVVTVVSCCSKFYKGWQLRCILLLLSHLSLLSICPIIIMDIELNSSYWFRIAYLFTELIASEINRNKSSGSIRKRSQALGGVHLVMETLAMVSRVDRKSVV